MSGYVFDSYLTGDGQGFVFSSFEFTTTNVVAPPRVQGPKPTFRNTDIGALVARVERVPERYPTYEFSGRTFYQTDKPG